MEKTRRDFLQSLVVVGASAGLLQTFGCGDDDGGTDGGMGGTDGGSTRTDGGMTGTDGGSTGTDGGMTGTDGGMTGTDGGSTGTDGGMMMDCADTTSSIGGNHPSGAHTLMVPIADVIAGAPMTYDITGASKHMHSITLSSADFAMILAGGSVTVTSTSGGAHMHDCTVGCAT